MLLILDQLLINRFLRGLYCLDFLIRNLFTIVLAKQLFIPTNLILLLRNLLQKQGTERMFYLTMIVEKAPTLQGFHYVPPTLCISETLDEIPHGVFLPETLTTMKLFPPSWPPSYHHLRSSKPWLLQHLQTAAPVYCCFNQSYIKGLTSLTLRFDLNIYLRVLHLSWRYLNGCLEHE